MGGFVPLSTVDWPDQLAAVVFLRGCPWDCPYCHNPHLRSGAPMEGDATWDDVTALLEQRVGLLDGVVFSGGEPTAQPALGGAVAQVRAMGLATALHTGGPVPDRLEALLPHLDWVGFDVKAPFAEYGNITGVPGSGDGALRSLRALVASGVPFEVRTTVHHDLLDTEALLRLADELRAEGVRDWALQAYRPQGTEPGRLGDRGFMEMDLPAGLSRGFRRFEIRR